MKPILDPCCGSRMWHFDKTNPNVLFADKRREEILHCADGRTISVNPEMLMDFKKMPFPDQTFYLVIFDPPHLKGCGTTGWQGQKYGTLGADWRNELKSGFDECMRVLKTNGTMIFKWNEESIKVSTLVELFGVTPLVGHRTRKASKTIWLTFFKSEVN